MPPPRSDAAVSFRLLHRGPTSPSACPRRPAAVRPRPAPTPPSPRLLRRGRTHRPPGSSTAAASTDAFGYAHMSSTRSRLFGGGKMLAKCVPRCLAMARLCSDAFPKGPRTRKTPVRGKICAPCIQNELVLARFARRASEKPCNPLFTNTPCANLARRGPFPGPRRPNHA